jgi:hypothetical protein
MQLINASENVEARSASPLSWSEGERRRLVLWAEAIFEDEHQEFGERARPRVRADATLWNDQRAALREAALAIGSMTRGSSGIRVNEPRFLRSMLAWFWLNNETACVIAPRAQLSRATLSDANLIGANLRGANLREADLREAKLIEADLREAKLIEADLSEAALIDANLSGANLSGANLNGAHLCGANLIRANLRGANLSGARHDNVTVWPEGFDAGGVGTMLRWR